MICCLTACGRGDVELPTKIEFEARSLYPEGVDFDPVRREFIVSSMRLGTVGRVTREGRYREIFRDKRFKSTVGIRVDTARDRILVCHTDHGRALRTSPATKYKTAGLIILRLSTGKLIRSVDLAAVSRPDAGKVGAPGNRRFSNDVDVDPKTGIAYVTDSYSPVIYRVTPEGRASILTAHPLLKGAGVVANGILFRGSHLLVAKFDTGGLLKISLKNRADIREVRLPRSFPRADGLVAGPGNSVLLIANGKTNRVVQLTSNDEWASAEVKAGHDTGAVFATTGTWVGNRVYVVHAQLHRIARDHLEPVTRFTIQGYDFQ